MKRVLNKTKGIEMFLKFFILNFKIIKIIPVKKNILGLMVTFFIIKAKSTI